jgi:1-acyl-sn-glycerol-3-phosphate acyltransferase
MIYGLMRALMRALTRTILVGLFTVSGTSKVPRTGALIVCPNHSGTVDPPWSRHSFHEEIRGAWRNPNTFAAG